MTAIRLVLDRLLSPARDRPIQLALPKINAASDLIAAASALTEATAASKGKSSAEGDLERRANTPSGDLTRDLAAAAMAIGSNSLSSTR